MVIATEGSRRNTPTQKKMYKNLSKKKQGDGSSQLGNIKD